MFTVDNTVCPRLTPRVISLISIENFDRSPSWRYDIYILTYLYLFWNVFLAAHWLLNMFLGNLLCSPYNWIDFLSRLVFFSITASVWSCFMLILCLSIGVLQNSLDIWLYCLNAGLFNNVTTSGLLQINL
jgi:hypothetical protein